LSTQVGPVEKNRKRLADIDKQILSKRQDTDFKSVMAFVTFNEDEAVNNCLIEFSRKGFGRRAKRFRGRKHLVVDPAPEPDTLLWENLEYDARNRSFRRFMGRTISVLSLSVGFGVIVASKGLQEFFSSEGTGGSFCDVQREIDPRGFREFQVERLLWLKHTLDYARYMAYLNCYCEVQSSTDPMLCIANLFNKIGIVLVGLLATLGVVVVNAFLKVIAKVRTNLEKHHTSSGYEDSLAMSQFLAKAMNTGIIMLIVNTKIDYFFTHPIVKKIPINGDFTDFTPMWFKKVGAPLVSTLLSNCVAPNIAQAVQYPVQIVKRIVLRNRLLTQRTLNEAFEGPPFKIADRYADL